MKRLCLTLALAFAACAVRAEAYSWDFSGAAAEAAEAPVVRRASMACAAEVPRFAVGDTLDLRLFDDVGFAFRIVSAPPAGIAGQSFIAKDENGSASAIVKVTDTAARISVDDFANRRQYTVRCKDGKVLIFERDNSQADGGECGTCGGEIEIPQPVVEEITTTSAKKSRTLLGASSGAEFPLAEQKSVVDILVAFDQGAKTKCSSLGFDGIEDFADYAVNKMNTVLRNSQLDDQFCYRLVGVIEIDGSCTAIDNALLLSMRAREGAFSKLSQLRDKYGADTITLLVNRTSGTTSGIGFEYDEKYQYPSSFDAMNYACNVCDINTVHSRYTMSHETGHNMGCGHSNRQGDNSGPGRYSYSCGYHFTDANKVKRHTVMAYEYAGDDDNDKHIAIPYFSAPDISPAEYGCALGVEGTNNNRRTLLQTNGDIAGLREHVLPYDWDVRVWEGSREITEGDYCKYDSYGNHTLILTHTNSAAVIYYTSNGTEPSESSAFVNAGGAITVNLEEKKTLKVCAVVGGTAQSVRTLTLKEGIKWSGEAGQNGNGRWSTDQGILSWNDGTSPFEKWATVVFPENIDNSSPAITVMGEIEPWEVAFTAINTSYTFNGNNESSVIKLRDANFAPSGDVTFNVPVQLSATTFTNMTGCALTFNAPFGQTVDATSGYCTNLVTILPYGTLTVAPGAGKTQTFDTLNNQNGGFSGNATFRVGAGKVIFKGAINSGAGVIGRTKLEVANGGELVFNVGGGTGFDMNNTSLTIEKGGVVTFNDMEHLRRALHFGGGTINAKRLDLVSDPGVYVTEDSSIENNDGGYILIRNSDSEINVYNGTCLTLNVGTQTDNRSDTSGWGIIKRGSGTLVANVELKHSGITDIESGTIEVGYSSGSTIYGLGWILAEGSALKVRGGCTLKTPTLTLDSGATICVPVSSSAPIVATNDVSVAGVYFEIAGADNLAVGASYPLLKGNAGISGVKNAKTSGLPELASGLKWQLEVADNTLYAKVVEKSALDGAVAFTSNDSSLALAMPDDASLAEGGGVEIAASPIVVSGTLSKAVSVAVRFVVPETSPSTAATICSLNLGGSTINCMRAANGEFNCYFNGLQYSASSTSTVALTVGEHLLQIGYYAERDVIGEMGTRVLLDGNVVYYGSGLKFSDYPVSRVTFGATAEDTSRFPYAGLVILETGIMNVRSSVAPPRMTSSGGETAYSCFVTNAIPRVFPLTPSGAIALDETVVEATFGETPGEASVSVMASFPADKVGTVCGMWVKRDTSVALPVAIQAEYDGNGKFYIRFNDNALNSEAATRLAETALDVSKPHLYTLTFKAGEGATFYQDGVALLKSESAFGSYSASTVVSPITFGCGPYHPWRGSAWHDYPNPAKDFSLFASHVALGTSDRAVSEAAVMASMATDEDDDDPSPPETPATVDVLVAYDNGAQAYVANKGVTLTEFAATQIEKMNVVLATNRLDRYYSYRLAGVCKVDGVYNNIDTAPSLIAAGEGPAVSLRAARELYGADTVTLLVDVTGNTLGNSSPLNSPNDVASQHECAFSVCSVRAVDTGKQHTMIHENAHNMGCGHARAQSIINSPFEYGRGYYFKDGNVTRHTIMAYGGDNDASWYFSTTSTEFGFVLGDKTNNNARVLKETCAEVAKWREGAAIALAGVDVKDVAFATSALYPWSVEGDAIRSFNQTNYQYQCTTPLKATIEGPKVLSFKHKSYFGGESVAGGNYSHFDVLLDDSPVLTQTECTNSWTEARVDIPEGTHEVVFVFSQRFAMNNSKDYKDGTPAADDAVWLKDIVLTDVVAPTELNIPAGTSVNLSDVGSAIETITGEGTLVCDATLPTKGYGLTNETWKGTVAFSGVAGASSFNNFMFENYGNANSRIELTNCCIPYILNNNGYFAGTLVLTDDGVNPAFKTTDGYSDNYNVIGALEGDGNMSFENGQRQGYVFNVATNYTGSIYVDAKNNNGTVGGRRIVFGSVGSAIDLPGQSATVTIKSGATASIGGGATWNAYNGVEIAGTLLVKGAGAKFDCNDSGVLGIKLDGDATLRFESNDANVVFARKFKFDSGTVKIAFADGAKPANNAVIATWPNTSTINGQFKLVGAVTNDYEIATNATGLVFKEKPYDRLDLSGYSYLTEEMLEDWLEENNFGLYEYDWKSFMSEINDRNGYSYLCNYLLGYYADDNRMFEAKIVIDADGNVVITTTEGTVPAVKGLVKKLYSKKNLLDPWTVKTVPFNSEKTTTVEKQGEAGFYKVSIEAD